LTARFAKDSGSIKIALTVVENFRQVNGHLIATAWAAREYIVLMDLGGQLGTLGQLRLDIKHPWIPPLPL